MLTWHPFRSKKGRVDELRKVEDLVEHVSISVLREA